ncbi:uncharacterized protein [Pocillopora verrucosa]|uniref:uncharacterized protein isoform X2 n=1 Tax=Pocillopora verrucosa TaxID=203993 RepID=UPI0033414386
MLAHLLQVSHSNHLNSGPNRELTKKCTHARASARVLMDEDEADVDMEFASGGDLEKVSTSPSSCTPTSKENGSIKETPKSSKKVEDWMYRFQLPAHRTASIDDELLKCFQPQIVAIGEQFDFDKLIIIYEGIILCSKPQQSIVNSIVALLSSFYIFNMWCIKTAILSFLEQALMGIGQGHTLLNVSTFFNPLTPTSDQDITSPYNLSTISSRKVMRIK